MTTNSTKRNTKKHDAIARKFFQDLGVAHKFLETYLPKNIKALCDLDKITIKSTSFIEANLKHKLADIVYEVGLKNEQSVAIVYCMIEAQSRAERFMPVRIIKYAELVLERYMDENPSCETLPLVIPFVFYNGRQRPYPYSTKLKDTFKHKKLYRKLPLGDFILIDLTKMSDRTIARHGKLAVLESAKKHVRDIRLVNSQKEFAKALKQSYEAELSIELMYSIYYYLVDHKSETVVKYLQEQIGEYLPYFERETMDYIEKIQKQAEKKGILAGLQQGREEGHEKGRKEGKDERLHEITSKMLMRGIDIETIVEITGFSTTEIKKLSTKLKKRKETIH